MNKPLDDTWFTEVYASSQSAFSIKAKKLHQEQTTYQLIEIYSTPTFGNVMAIDGFVMLTSRDNFLYHEMITHPALFTHPNPKQVAIVGGGDCGTLQQVLKHQSVETAWQIEIDPRVTQLSEQFFPELCQANKEPRAHLLFQDAIEWFKQVESDSLDIIIIDSSEPVGPGAGLFTAKFYADCARSLRTEGIIVHQSESPLFHFDNIIKPMHQAMHEAGFAYTQTLPFPQPCYPSGWWSATLASMSTPLTQFRAPAAREKAFTTQYYNEGIHKGALALPEFMQRELG